MTDWLSATWEASWRPFQYFNLDRLVLAGLVLLAALLPEGWIASLHLGYSLAFMLAVAKQRGTPWSAITGTSSISAR